MIKRYDIDIVDGELDYVTRPDGPICMFEDHEREVAVLREDLRIATQHDCQSCPWRDNETYCTHCSGHEHLCTHKSQIEGLLDQRRQLTADKRELVEMLEKVAKKWIIGKPKYTPSDIKECADVKALIAKHKEGV